MGTDNDRHGVQVPHTVVSNPRRGRTASPASSIATSAHAKSPMAPLFAAGLRRPTLRAASLPSSTISTESVVGPVVASHLVQQQPGPAWSEPYSLPLAAAPRPFPPDLVFGLSASEDSPFYSSDSCYSPVSEGPLSHFGNAVYVPDVSQAHVADCHSAPLAMPVSVSPAFSPWAGFEEVPPSFDQLGIDYDSHYPAAVGISQYAYGRPEPRVDSILDTTTPTTHALVGRGDGGAIVRSEPCFAAGLVVGKDGLVNLEGATLQHYLECYWTHFHPVFPVIHRPTIAAIDYPFLKTMMLAIGAQLSHRPAAGLHSMSWFEFGSSLGATVRVPVREAIPIRTITTDANHSQFDPLIISSRSPIVELQAIFLLEVFSLYRSRAPGVHQSRQFEALYLGVSPPPLNTPTSPSLTTGV